MYRGYGSFVEAVYVLYPFYINIDQMAYKEELFNRLIDQSLQLVLNGVKSGYIKLNFYYELIKF